ncbi:MAG: CapA family protein [Lachnospiraceae bacterium]|nr:CapA family protein [Lachnospiraceae bacterium]
MCVLIMGGIALSTVYVIRMHDVKSGLSQLATDSEHVLEEAFPFDMSGGEKTQAAESAEESADTGKYAELLADPQRMKEENTYAKTPSVPGEVTMTFTGDVMFDDSYSIMSTYRKAGDDVNGCMSSDLLDTMRASDILMLNNECTFTNRGTPTADKAYTFRCKPENVKILQDMGADIVSLANNHAYDYGEISLLDTLDTLNNASIPYVGAGKNIEEASKPVYFIAGDLKVAVLSATQIERVDNPDTKGATENAAGVFRCRDPEALCEAITKAKENCDYVIVYVHWGTENETDIDWAQRDQAPMYAEAGADLIIGDHPHILQGITYIGDTPVIYSLGNFWFNSRTIDTGMVQATFDANGLKSFQFIPCLQSGCRTTQLSGGEKERVLQEMRNLSPDVTIDGDGYVQK